MTTEPKCLPQCRTRIESRRPKQQHAPGCPNAEAPKVQIVDLMGALKRSLDQHPNAKPAPAPEPKLCHAGCKLNDLGVHVPDCDNRPNHTPEPKQGSEEPIEPVTELEAVKHTNKILRAQLAKAWAETDEARATKDMHKERQEEAWAEVAALRAELAAAKERVEELESMLLRNSCLARVCECGTSSELCGEANDIRANRKKEESK